MSDDIESLRTAAAIMRNFDKYIGKEIDVHFVKIAASIVEDAAEILENKRCRCGHLRTEHYLGANISAQCPICCWTPGKWCDEFKPAG